MWQTFQDAAFLAGLGARAAAAIRQFRAVVDDARAELARGANPGLVLRGLLDGCDYHGWLKRGCRTEAETAERAGNVHEVLEELSQAGRRGKSLQDFLDDSALAGEREDDDLEARAGVTLITLHAAKGLEFPVVCIAGAEAGLLPLAPRQPLIAEAERAHLEEERRLFYVGLTRAITTLCVSWAASRTVPGEPMAERQPSPFLADIPAHLLTAAPRLAAAKARPVRRQLSLFPGHD